MYTMFKKMFGRKVHPSGETRIIEPPVDMHKLLGSKLTRTKKVYPDEVDVIHPTTLEEYKNEAEVKRWDEQAGKLSRMPRGWKL